MVVVPVATAVGWELVLDDQVVVVYEVRTVRLASAAAVEEVEVIVVVREDGEREEVEIVREDDDFNADELEGSALPEGDSTTPGVESTVEVEEEIEVES